MEESSSKESSGQKMSSTTAAVKADEGCRKDGDSIYRVMSSRTGLGLVWQLVDTTWHTGGGCLYFRTWDDWTFQDNKTQPSSLGSEGEFGVIIAPLSETKGSYRKGDTHSS